MKIEAVADAALYRESISEYARSRGHGDAVTKETKEVDGYIRPKSVYVIYISLDASDKLVARQAEEYNFPDDILAAEKRVLTDAKNNANLVGRNFERMNWSEPSYITLALGIPGWKFFWGGKPGHDPIVFLANKELRSTGTRNYEENHSFFDAKPDRIKLDDGTEHEAVRLVNYVRDAAGKPVGPGITLNYCFEIYLKVPFSVAGKAKDITILIDPDGQNQGPIPLPVG